MDKITGLTRPEAEAVRQLPQSMLPPKPFAEWGQNEVLFAWCQAFKKPYLPLNESRVDHEAYGDLYRHCMEHAWLPLFYGADSVFAISPHAHNPQTRRSVSKLLRREVYWAGCSRADYDRTIAAMGVPHVKATLPPPVSIPSAWILKPDHSNPAPYRPCVIEVLFTAYNLGASDVFFQTEQGGISVRFRLSGIAEVFPPIPKRKSSVFMAEIKRMAGFRTNDNSSFQDSRFEAKLPDGNVIEIRAAYAPTADSGETIALRLQDSRKMIKAGLQLPFPPRMVSDFKSALHRKGGMILLTGPTGSGKTTTLYAALLSLDRADLVIRTIEDPVEITIPGISQTPVGGNTGRTFADALRSFLRLNPDVILVGEIRDAETAALAVEASQTGHLLLSTLHAMDAVSTINRLLDMVPGRDMRGSLAQTLEVVVSQRLAPRLCQVCKDPRDLTDDEQLLYRKFNLSPPTRVFRRHGCPECGTGVRHREPIFEMLRLTPELRDVIVSGDSFHTAKFRDAWMRLGGKPLGKHALELAAQGLITLEDAKSHMVWVPDTP